MSFREPLFAILFPEAYVAQRDQMLRDWATVCGALVTGLVLCAWLTQPGVL